MYGYTEGIVSDCEHSPIVIFDSYNSPILSKYLDKCKGQIVIYKDNEDSNA